MKDSVKTVGAIIIIGLIVVATFLYGNRQRQQQIQRDQMAQQSKQSQNSTEVTVSPSGSSTQVKPASPSSPQPAPASGQNVGGGSVPTTGGSGVAQTPQTGGEVWFAVPLGLMAGLWQLNRYSQRRVSRAQLDV